MTVTRAAYAAHERSACTSIEVIRTTHHLLNTVVALVHAVSRDARGLAAQVEKATAKRPLQLQLEVIQALPPLGQAGRKDGLIQRKERHLDLGARVSGDGHGASNLRTKRP